MKRRVYLPDHISNHYRGQFLVYDSRQCRFGALDEETNQIAWMWGNPHLKTTVQRFWSSCNGLVCFLLCDSEDIYLCNPLTGECISIPGPRLGGLAAHIHHCGLGFCSSSNEYKLTCLTPHTLNTYTLGSSTGWRSVPLDHKKIWSWWRAAIYVNGVFHWLLKTQSILTFDLATEVLGTIPPPLLEDGKKIYKLTCMDHCLVVTAGYKKPLGLDKRLVGLDIWGRKEDKSSGESVWTKNWVIDADQRLIQISLYWLVPQKLSTKGHIIMRDHGDKLYSYDSRDKLVRHSWDYDQFGGLLYSYSDPRDKLVRRYSDCNQFGGRLCSYYTPTLISPKKLMQKTDKYCRRFRKKEGK